MDKNIETRLLPFSLTLLVVALDQLTKWIVTMTIKPWSVGAAFFGDFFRLVRVYNPGIAFSIGGDLSGDIRGVLFGLMPLVVIFVVVFVYFRSKDLNGFQRWCIAGIVGGGLGNLIDRFFRPDGVLDFIDVKFYGLFGFERWPTFNVADSAVVVCGVLLMVSLFLSVKQAGAEESVK
jgi:signal peptidase II